MFSEYLGMKDDEAFKAVQDNPGLSAEHLQQLTVIMAATVLRDPDSDRLAAATGVDRDFIADVLNRVIDCRSGATRIFNVEPNKACER